MKVRTNFMYLLYQLREDIMKKIPISYGPVRKRGGGGKPPGHNQNGCLFSEKEKNMHAECPETEKYANIFCDLFARVKTFF